MITNAKQERKPQQLSTDAELYGRLLPHSTEAERYVIGSLLLETKAFRAIEDILSPEDFYERPYELIFSAILQLNAKRYPVDLVSVMEELRTMGELDTVGGAPALAKFTTEICSAAHIERHAHCVKDKSIARKLIHITSEIQSRSYDGTEDVGDVLESLETMLTDLVSNAEECQSVEMPEAVSMTLAKAAKLQEMRNKGINPAIPTHLMALTREFAGGWRAPDLIVIGARPSMGKTQHALSIAQSASMSGINTLFVSIEMTVPQLINRLLLEDERISEYNIRNGELSRPEWEAIDRRSAQIRNAKLHIADNHNIRNLSNIKSEARRLKRKGKLGLLIIDYLGLVRTNMKFSARYLEVAYITGELKALAKELDIPVILLSQLSRSEKGASVKEPRLEDLRESGDIEQDADIVLFIHKPDYYDPNAQDSNGVLWKNRGKLIIAKYREGARNNTIIFGHDNRYKKIFDYEPPGITPSIKPVANHYEPVHVQEEYLPF